MRKYNKVEKKPNGEPDPKGSGFFCGHMLVRVNSCRDSHLWYREWIGEKFCLIEQDHDTYLVRSPDGYTNVIWREDGILVRPKSDFPHIGWGDGRTRKKRD